MIMSETGNPITGICLVTKPHNVPTGYDCIRKTHDDPNRDADLMPDSLLERKDRFLCITRSLPSNPQDRPMILEDIKVISERDSPPMYYSALTHTADTREKGTARKLICVKMVDRQAGMKCICDIIFLYKSKRPPQSYTVIGDINGLQMCVKEGNVPALRVAPAPPPISTIPHDFYRPPQQLQTQLSEYGAVGTLTKRSDEKEILDGIPFKINSKYLRQEGKSNGFDGLETFRLLTPYEIEQQFHYDFHLERASFN